ncbi:MAG TPA: DUF1343 domain-containing protein, partial [Candidatus Limnocylindrales bacterium]|nr:DUF1343 domain-containing protein [Candidatus Limnocylindrales bacterium]
MEPRTRLRKVRTIVWMAVVLGCVAGASSGPSAHAAGKPKPAKGHSWRVQTGIDVLAAQKFAPLRGKHVGLITNHTGVDFNGKSTIELLAHAPGVEIVALFSPEHGIAGHADEKVASSKDASTGLPIYSLYGEHTRPTEEMLKGLDALVFDIQDAGVRFYTYTTTMGYCMEEAAKHNIAFYVLDRPNPINGDTLEGPVLDADKTSFVAYFPLPVRYGLTIGELAQFFNVENHINCDLHVIAMKNWRRNYFYENTGVRWIPPSPNLRTTKGAILYPGLEILQNAGVSVGRGTQAPFEEFGAPWMDGDDVAQALNGRNLPGVHFLSQPFIPVSGLYAGKRCGGVTIRVTDRAATSSMRIGLEIAALLQRKYPSHFDAAKTIQLIGNDETVKELIGGTPPEKIIAGWAKDLAAYDQVRRKY